MEVRFFLSLPRRMSRKNTEIVLANPSLQETCVNDVVDDYVIDHLTSYEPWKRRGVDDVDDVVIDHFGEA